jgi:hypothetical protein
MHVPEDNNEKIAIFYHKDNRVKVKSLGPKRTSIKGLSNYKLPYTEFELSFDDVIILLHENDFSLVNCSDNAQLLRFHPDIIKRLT